MINLVILMSIYLFIYLYLSTYDYLMTVFIMPMRDNTTTQTAIVEEAMVMIVPSVG